MSFRPDGKQIASAGEDGSIRVWDAQTGRIASFFRSPAGAVRSVAFSPDGKRVVAGCVDHTIRMWIPAPVPKENQGKPDK